MGNNERLYVMEPHLQLKRFQPLAGLELRTRGQQATVWHTRAPVPVSKIERDRTCFKLMKDSCKALTNRTQHLFR